VNDVSSHLKTIDKTAQRFASLSSGMQCVRSLTNLDVEPLREHLASCGQPFKTSELYATADASRFADTSVRLSESRAIVDPKLAALSEARAWPVTPAVPVWV